VLCENAELAIHNTRHKASTQRTKLIMEFLPR
jgi:hypothetical protein